MQKYSVTISEIETDGRLGFRAEAEVAEGKVFFSRGDCIMVGSISIISNLMIFPDFIFFLPLGF